MDVLVILEWLLLPYDNSFWDNNRKQPQKEYKKNERNAFYKVRIN